MRVLGLVVVLIAGCAGPEAPTQAGWIAPFDGQTNFNPSQDLLVSMQGVRIPEDYPLNELVRVMDLLDGGTVPGTVTLDESLLRFSPDAPWATDRRCGWTLYDPLETAHGPEVHLPVATGTAVFEVSDNIHALDLSLGEMDGAVCMLLSRPVDSGLDVRVWIEDREYLVLAEAQPESWDDYELPDTDLGAGVRCFDPPEPLEDGDALRLQIEGTGATLFEHGPWRLEVSSASIAELLAERRRATLTPSEWDAQ